MGYKSIDNRKIDHQTEQTSNGNQQSHFLFYSSLNTFHRFILLSKDMSQTNNTLSDNDRKYFSQKQSGDMETHVFDVHRKMVTDGGRKTSTEILTRIKQLSLFYRTKVNGAQFQNRR